MLLWIIFPHIEKISFYLLSDTAFFLSPWSNPTWEKITFMGVQGFQKQASRRLRDDVTVRVEIPPPSTSVCAFTSVSGSLMQSFTRSRIKNKNSPQ